MFFLLLIVKLLTFLSSFPDNVVWGCGTVKRLGVSAFFMYNMGCAKTYLSVLAGAVPYQSISRQV